MTLVVGFAPARDDRTSLDLAATMARSAGQDLVAVSVVPAGWPTPVAGHTDREFEAWASARGQSAVAEAEARLREQAPDLTSRALWAAGRSVPATLLQAAAELDAAMIVIGSGHRAPYGHLHLTSTADRLLHSSTIPVAIATRGYRASPDARLTRVTCAFRGDEVSRRTLERTALLCHDVGVGLRVATFAVRGRDMYPPELPVDTEDAVLDRWVAQAESAQTAALDDLSARSALPASVESVVARGRSWAAALDGLPWDRDEVLVLGSSSAGAMSRIFLGSSATRILRHAPVPCVVVP